MNQSYQVCNYCVMDTSDPDIQFDAKGRCNHCRTYDARAKEETHEPAVAEHLLTQLIGRIRDAGRGRNYDCIIGVSGGVDSTYLALKVRQWGLRPLAVHLDNGWNSNLAVQNIERALNKLSIDLKTVVLNWEEFRSLQVAFLRASTPDSEVPTDHAIEAVLSQAAKKFGVQYIIGGSNFATEAIMPRAWSHGMKDWKYIRTVNRIYGDRVLRTFPHLSITDYAVNAYVRKLKMVHPLNLIPYLKELAVQELESELGWKKYENKHFESIYTRFFQGYILPRKFGFDKRRGHLSTLVCSKQIDRTKALSLLAEPICDERKLLEDRDFSIKKLGLKPGEFEAIMAAPPRRFEDFDSYERSWWYGMARSSYRKLRHRAMGTKQLPSAPNPSEVSTSIDLSRAA